MLFFLFPFHLKLNIILPIVIKFKTNGFLISLRQCWTGRDSMPRKEDKEVGTKVENFQGPGSGNLPLKYIIYYNLCCNSYS